MKRIVRDKKTRCLVIFSVMVLFGIAGCTEYLARPLYTPPGDVGYTNGPAAASAGTDDSGFNKTISLLKVLQTGNAASTPINPIAIPVGVALTGIITLLEALRRKEKDARKHAEHELKNGNGNNGK